jgi:hypothetical protein
MGYRLVLKRILSGGCRHPHRSLMLKIQSLQDDFSYRSVLFLFLCAHCFFARSAVLLMLQVRCRPSSPTQDLLDGMARPICRLGRSLGKPLLTCALRACARPLAAVMRPVPSVSLRGPGLSCANCAACVLSLTRGGVRDMDDQNIFVVLVPAS